MPVETITIPDVPLVETGTYELSTGPATFTEEDLRAAVAALADPAVKVPRVKVDGLAASFDPAAHGGEPALGRVDNLRVTEDGQTLLGDLVVPAWLGESLDLFYPARSIEGMQGWESPTGKRHDLVISAVALLGVDLPGVSTLEDLQELMSANGPTPKPQEVLARMPARPGRVAAGLDQDLVRRRFYEWIEGGDAELPEGTTAWGMWVRSLRFDDSGTPYLKVDAEDVGRLYRVDFKVSGAEVTFDGFTEVVEQDVAVAASAAPAGSARTLAAWSSREESRRVLATATTPTEEGNVPLDLDALRQRLGLAADADEDAINAALAADPAPANDNPGDEPEEQPAGEPALPVAASRGAAPEGVVMIDAEELARLRSGAETAQELQARMAREERDRVLAAAMQEGRFPPSRREHYERAWASDPEGTRTLLTAPEDQGGLAPNTVPVAARAAQPSGEAGGTEDADHEAYMARHFPQVAARRRSREQGRVTVRTEV